MAVWEKDGGRTVKVGKGGAVRTRKGEGPAEEERRPGEKPDCRGLNGDLSCRGVRGVLKKEGKRPNLYQWMLEILEPTEEWLE